MAQPVMAQPIMGVPMVQEMMKGPQVAVSGTVVNFCVSDCTMGDELDDHRYWLRKDGLSAEVVPPALEAAGMSQGAWRQLHQDIDACNDKRCNKNCFLLICMPTCGLCFTGSMCYCMVKGCAVRDAYLGICRRYESEYPQLMFKLTTVDSYIEMPETGYPHTYGKHDIEKIRGRFVFQIIVR